MFESLLADLGLKKAALLAGFVGSIVSLRFVTELHGAWSRASMVVCGTLTAAYVSPALAEVMSVSARVEHGLTFAVGLFGMSMAGALLAFVRDKGGDVIGGWLKRPGS